MARRIGNYTPNFDYSERTDNTSVTPSKRFEEERIAKLNLAVRRLKPLRLSMIQDIRRRKEEDAQLEKMRREEEARVAAEKRAKDNAEYYRKLQEKRQEEYEKSKKEAEELKPKVEKKREEEYFAWLKDVQDNGDKYSPATRDVVKRAMHSYKHPKDILARLDRFIARRHFDIKNATGQTIVNSIDTYGETILGKKAINEIDGMAADMHQHVIDLQETIYDLKDLQNKLAEHYGFDPEYVAMNPNDSRVQQFKQRHNELQGQINNLQSQLNDKDVKALDEYYKQSYVKEHGGFFSGVNDAIKGFQYNITYDQYKQDFLDRQRKEDIDKYNRSVLERNSSIRQVGRNYDVDPYKPSSQELTTLLATDPNRLFLKSDSEALARRRSQIKALSEEYDNEYKENRKSLAEAEEAWNISEYYKLGQLASRFDKVWSPDYAFYQLPPMIGSTYSSPQARLAALLNAAGMAGSVALAPVSGGLSSAAYFGSTVASLPLQYTSGHDENYAESGTTYVDNVANILKSPSVNRYKPIMDELKTRSRIYYEMQGRSKKWIDDYLMGEQGDKNAFKDYFMGLTKSIPITGSGLESPILDPALLFATTFGSLGIKAQFDANNMRTMYELYVQTAAQLTPVGSLKKGIGFVIDRNASRIVEKSLLNNIEKDAAGRVTAKTAAKATTNTAKKADADKYVNGFRRKSVSDAVFSGWERGAETASAMGFGFGGRIVGGTVGAIANGGVNLARRTLNPAAKRLFDRVESATLNKYQLIYDKLLPEKAWAKALVRYGGKSIKAAAISSMSEAAEEAVQYLNSKSDFAGRYGWNGMNLANMVVNDIYQGSRVFGAYASLFGIGDSELLNDAEYWANLKGGFALGGMHTGVMTVAGNAVNAYRQYGIQEGIVNSAVMHRELDKIDRASNVEFARLAMRNRSNEVDQVLDWMENSDKKREQPYFTQEAYDEKRKAARVINQMTHDPEIRAKLEAKGIVYGTEKYANAIADLYSIQDRQLQNQIESMENASRLGAKYGSKAFMDELNSMVDSFLNIDAANQELANKAKEASEKAVQKEIAEAQKNGVDTESEEFKAHLERIKNETEDTDRIESRKNLSDRLLSTTRVVNRLRALLELKAQINTTEDFYSMLRDKFNLHPMRPDASVIRDAVNKEIEDQKQNLKKLEEYYDPAMSDGATLDFLDGVWGVVKTSEDGEIQRLELADAMIGADRAVSTKYMRMFNEGLKKNEDGTYSYTPKKGNPYSEKIDAIIKARKENGVLDWMNNDIVNGDGITTIFRQYDEETEDEKNDAKQKAKEQSERSPFETEEDSQPQQEEQILETSPVVENPVETENLEQKLNRNKRQYEARKNRAKRKYEKRKKTLKEWRRRSLNSGIPFLNAIAEISNELLSLAEQGVYKFIQFVQDIKDIVSEEDFNQAVPLLKELYIKRRARYLFTNSAAAANMDPASEVMSYGAEQQINPILAVHSPLYKELLTVFDKDAERINDTISTHYDVIATDENGEVHVYTNTEAVKHSWFGENNASYRLMIERLENANTSDENFRSKIQEYIGSYSSFPVEEYVKYRTVPGIIPALARNFYKEMDSYIEVGIIVRNAVLSIIFGQEENIRSINFPNGFDGFRKDVLELKQYLNQQGLTILDTRRRIYGQDKFGNYISSEADIIAADAEGKIVVIDVRSGYTSIISRWKKPPTAGLKFTIEELVTDIVKQTETLINTKFGRVVQETMMFPVVWDRETFSIFVERYNGSLLYPVSQITIDHEGEDIDLLKDRLKNSIEEINHTIREYNEMVDYASRYTDQYSKIDEITYIEMPTIEDVNRYSEGLHAKYDDLNDRISQIKELVSRSQQEESIVVEEHPEIFNVLPPYQENLIFSLEDACNNLDIALQYVNPTKPTTDAEKNAMQHLHQALFEAQIALDAVLQAEDTRDVDVTKEEEVIATAMEFLYKNKDVFGETNSILIRWWLNNFVFESPTNTQAQISAYNEQYTKFLRSITSWTQTLRQHVQEDLDEDDKLQTWYSTLFNVYFTKLLENAEVFVNLSARDTKEKEIILRHIEIARNLLDQFNTKYLVGPDQGFDTPIASQADVINRIPVRWKDLYNINLTHSPSFNEMSDNPNYWDMSITPGFAQKATFRLYEKNGKLMIYIKYFDRRGKERFADLSFFNDVNSRVLTPEEQERWLYVNAARKRFINKALKMLAYVKAHPEYEIQMQVTTDKGSIAYDKPGNTHNPQEFLFHGEGNKHDLYTISLSSKDRVGLLLVRIDKNATAPQYAIRAGKNLTEDIGGFDRLFIKNVYRGSIKIPRGTLIYMYDTGDKQYIGVPMPGATIGVNDAIKIVNLLQKYILDKETTYNGFDILLLLKQRIYIADESTKKTSYNKIDNMVIINGNDVIIGNETYDIVSKKEDLINRIAGMQNAFLASLLNENLSTSSNQVFDKAKSIFINTNQNTVELPNGFVLQREDFTHKNQSGPSGSTWLGYLIRNGYIFTSARFLRSKQMNIGEMRLVNKQEQAPIDTHEEIKQRDDYQAQQRAYDEDDFISSLAMTVKKEDVDLNRSSEEQESFVQDVLNYFESVLGENGTVQFDDNDKEMLGTASQNQVIAGICSTELIKLSKFAPKSAAWHEAFHKVFELLIPAEQRDAFYKAYRKRHWWNKELSDRDIAEAFADMFVSWMSDQKILKSQAKWYRKIMPYMRSLAKQIGIAFKIGINNQKRMYTLYHDMNAGKYKYIKISEEQKKRFEDLFGEGLYYTIKNSETGHSENFEHIANASERDDMVKALGYYILRAYNVVNDVTPDVSKIKIISETLHGKLPVLDKIDRGVVRALTREGAEEDELDHKALAFREVFTRVEEESVDEKGKKHKIVKYPKFDALAKHVSDYIGTIVNTQKRAKLIDEDTQEDSGDTQNELEELQNSNIEKFDKASFEFSKLESVTDKAKLFFGTIPYMTIGEDGRIILDYSHNQFDVPSFYPLEEVYSKVVKYCNECTTFKELNDKLFKLAQDDLMFRRIFDKFHYLVYGAKNVPNSGMYKYDENGEITDINYDREALAIQILQAVSSQKIDFVVALSKKQEDGQDKGKVTNIRSSSMDRDSKSMPRQWTQYLLSGQVSVFKREREFGLRTDVKGNRMRTELVFIPGKETIFKDTARFFSQLIEQLPLEDETMVIDGVLYNKSKYSDTEAIKQEICHRLRNIGIMFLKDALDNMLLEEYGGRGSDAIVRWLMSLPVNEKKLGEAKRNSINPFIDLLNKFASDDGRINQKLVLETGYEKSGFVIDLAKWQGEYNHTVVQRMAYGLNGKKLNSISQNSSISHIINALNTNNKDNDIVSTISRFGYNVTTVGGIPVGSIILKAIEEGNLHLNAHVYLGFKTDNNGDSGTEYVNESTIEDYIAKMSMLQQGYLIFPTLADKGTWVIMDGVDIPGMSFIDTQDENGKDTTIVRDAPTVKFINGKPYIIPNSKVINQMLEYARTERLAIQRCMADLGYKEIPGYEDEGRLPIPKDAYIKNYHTPHKDKPTKKVVEPNGTRFFSLTKIVVNEYNEQTKKYELTPYNLNDPRVDSVTLLKRANDKFFNKTPEEQAEIMALTLAIQNQHEVETAVNLGIVNRVSYSEKISEKTTWSVSKDDDGLLNLDTDNLNMYQIEALTNHFMKHTKTGDIAWNQTEDVHKRAFYYRTARSLAIAAILGDVTNRSIICSQEVQRCFSGHPGMFKVEYNVQAGTIKDSAFDIQKRIGGMVSTGDDNIIDLPGIQQQYTCAECKDYEVGSSAQIAGRLDEMFISSQMRYIYGIKTGNWKKAYDTKDVLQLYDGSCDKSLDKAKELGGIFGSAYKKDINVADGAAYITEDMCANLLRMRGAYTGKVKEAFDLLKSDDSKYSWKLKRDAYKLIYDEVNIVSTKYTAYGFRKHILDKESVSDTEPVSDIAVPYYNKFALFPLFSCIATGKMDGIYNKMKTEGVDMLLMTSAVKVGSLGAVSFDGEKIEKPFNKYYQSYSYLRRQLNTDPEEGHMSAVGSQMIKIGLLNLVLDRDNYIDVNTGEKVTGRKILSDFMDSINQLALLGVYKTIDKFFTDGKLDADKLSEYLKDLLGSRNANKVLLECLQVIETAEGKLMRAPLAATADSSWIESIIISTINKNVIDIITPGSSFIQRSVFAIEGKAGIGEGTIVGDENMDKSINNGDRLEMINEDSSMDAVISIDYFDDIVFHGKLKDMSFEEKRKWLFDHGIIGKGAKANTIGYRIPTQAQSSIHALRFVDVVSAVKTTIILPQEFTKITGSDFDIDHLYLSSYNYNVGVSEDGHLYVTTTFNPSENEGQYLELYYQNRMLDQLMILLKDTDNSINSLYKSIDNDTELITKISDLIPEEGSTKDDPYNIGTLHEQVLRKNDYITGKKGIGPYALNVTNQILTQLFGVSFRKTRFTEATGILKFNHLIDFDDNAVASWLSAFINAHVDIVKDPYISRLNVNAFTYNMSNLLIRSGWGSRAVWFLAQPIIRDMSAANDFANSQYMKDPDATKNGESPRESAILKAVIKYLAEEECSAETLSNLLNSTTEDAVLRRIDIVLWVRDNQDVLKKLAINPNDYKNPEQKVTETYTVRDIQLNVFYAWKILEKYSVALGDLVQHTKIDTKKHGKNLIAIRKYFKEYNNIFHANQEDSLWDIESLEDLANGSWIELKTNVAINLPLTILGQQTFNANPIFNDAVMRLADILSHDGKKIDEAGYMHVARSLLTAVKSEYFVKYAKECLGMDDKDIAGLFIGPNSMSRRLVRLKCAIENNPKYKRLENNAFINLIYSTIEDNPVFTNGRVTDKPAFITVLDNVDQSRVNSDALSDGWLDMLTDEDEFVRDFAKKMILYAFFTSGEFKGWNKMLKYVPAEWIFGEVDPEFESYSDFISKKLQSNTDYSLYFDDVVANNFMNFKYVKRMRNVNDDNTRNFINADKGVKIGRSVKYDLIDGVARYITVKKEGVMGRGQDAYDLYHLIDVVKNGKEYFPVYAKIKKRGYHKTGFDIYEYGWNFNYAENEVAGADNFDFDSAVQRVAKFIEAGALVMSEANQRAIEAIYLKDNEVEIQNPEEVKVDGVAPGIYIATRGYRKGDPQKHPAFSYVFTENAQAYIASAPMSDTISADLLSSIGNTANVKTNVSDAGGTNQAGIRTDENGVISTNAFGIVVKKRQQDEFGQWLLKEGLFEDTDEDFELFKSLNEDMFARLNNYGNKVVIFPRQMALGKAALPKRFAQWLQDLLAERFNIVSTMKKNETPGYEGYGLELNEINSTSYDWLYMEDSWSTDILNELPPKVKMNGRFVYRPRYEFGRIYLTDNEREYIQERVLVVDNDGKIVSSDVEQISSIINAWNKFTEAKGFNYITIPYREWKELLNVDTPMIENNNFETVVNNHLIPFLEDANYINTEKNAEYDRRTKMITLDKDFYELVKIIRDNITGYLIMSKSLEYNFDVFARLEYINDAYEYFTQDVYDAPLNGTFTLKYYYEDKRQQELFSDKDFEDDSEYPSDEMNHCKH